MTINANDIKLRASKVMADVPEGGGGPSGNVILWGQSNTVFEDIDTISRVLGNVSIRQLHLHTDTANTDRLLGSYAIVAKLPADPKVSVTLAQCAPFDRRSDLSNAVANYLIRGVPWAGFLLGNHVQGQANLQIFQRPGTPVPTIGRTLALIVNEGLSTEKLEWVRIIKVASETRLFYDPASGTDFPAQVVTCDLQTGMSQAMPGTDPNRAFTAGSGKTVIRDTTAADAAKYYGAAPLVLPGVLGDLKLRVNSVYGQLVPSSSTPVPTLDQRPAAQRTITLATAPRRIDVPATPHTRRIKISQENRGLSYIAQLTPLPEPGTVVITWVGLGNRQTVQDDGAGSLTGAGAGTLNGLTGSLALTLPSLPDVGSAIVISYGERVAYTNRSSQGASVRAPSYVWQLDGEGQVLPGTLTLRYTSNGVVRTCTAGANGAIGGDGSGRIDHPSRTVMLRPAYMPDAGGQILCEYELDNYVTEILPAPAPDAAGFVQLHLAQQPVAGSLSIGWATATNITLTGGGLINVAIAASSGDQYAMNAAGGASAIMADASGSALAVSAQKDTQSRVVYQYRITDNGAGGFFDSRGTVDYAGRAVSLRVLVSAMDGYRPGQLNAYASDYELTSGAPAGGYYSEATYSETLLAGSSVTASYRVGAPLPVQASMSYTPPTVTLDLCPYTTDRVVPGSVQFTWMNTAYRDVEGVLYRDWSATSPGIVSGTMDYASGLAHMSDYVVSASGNPLNFTLQSLWTQKGNWTAASVFFMTAASPIQPGQITVSLLDVAGTLINVECDLNGNLTGPHAQGKVEFQGGLAEIQFGDWVDAGSLTAADKAEWWYSPANVAAGKIWRPWPIDPASLRYNAVSNFYLPVDPEILGLNPVRLPQDGRVPIFAKGRVTVIGHNATLPPATYANGQVIDLGRQRVSHVWLIGADGKLIDGGYTATEDDLDAGQVRVQNVTGWAQPVTVEHRIQDVALCTDVQIDGTLSINIPLSHVYPIGSVVSSALLFGTVFARVSNTFSQQAWDGITWKDSVTGNPAPGVYNDAAYPLKVSNAGALSERYALRFNNDATTFNITGQFSGGLGSGTKNATFKPANPFNSGVPLFELSELGWGSNWVSGNTLFLKLEAAMSSMAVIRTVQPGNPVGIDYSFDLLGGGDVDRPPGAP